ncbi:MAG: hypothetical protein KDE19_17500, partial [Caldilineaceae bacterium]|nr:hypothetical protein [Caldilineaceae bacterium]
IDGFLDNNGILAVNRTLVAGYDFMQDGTERGDTAFAAAGIGDGARTRLLGNGWNATQLRTQMLAQRNDITFFAAHAAHDQHATPDNSRLNASDVRDATANLAGTLVYALACHGGLNVPGIGHAFPTDFAEAWAGRGANFVGSTGWAYGFPRTLAYQEVLMANFSELLVDGEGGVLGEALVQAKRDYYAAHAMNHFHVKTLVGTALYGLPMLRVQPPGASMVQAAGADATAVARVHSEQFDRSATALRERSTYFIDTAGLQRVDTANGSYYTFSGQRPYAEANQSVQPQLQMILSAISADGALLTPRGVIFRGAGYEVQGTLTPLIEPAGILDGQGQQGEFLAKAQSAQRDSRLGLMAGSALTVTTPTLPVHLGVLPQDGEGSALLAGSNPARLTVVAGRYDVVRNVQQLFQDVTVDKYYSADDDSTAPTIGAVQVVQGDSNDTITVQAMDESGIERVVVTFDDTVERAWRSIELIATNGVWQGTLPATPAYFVQVVDAAGNVAVQMAAEDSAAPTATTVFLPLVVR